MGFAGVLPDPLGHGELVPLGPHLGELLFESGRLHTPRGDPLQHLGVHHARSA
ncbi:hypothetical protein [Streptomyces sp. NBC_00046]|uniref:hypothetical protein n=1 Tax=Streptomyces sp. NBC_00046 TaxID=2975626 RepID=UPI00324B084A